MKECITKKNMIKLIKARRTIDIAEKIILEITECCGFTGGYDDIYLVSDVIRHFSKYNSGSDKDMDAYFDIIFEQKYNNEKVYELLKNHEFNYEGGNSFNHKCIIKLLKTCDGITKFQNLVIRLSDSGFSKELESMNLVFEVVKDASKFHNNENSDEVYEILTDLNKTPEEKYKLLF